MIFLSPFEQMYYDMLTTDMVCGLEPKDLNIDEIDVLIKAHGKDWFDVLGYAEHNFEPPKLLCGNVYV